MQLKSFIIPELSPERNEGDVNSFLRSHRVLRIERHLVNDDTGACWAVLVEYAEDGHAESARPTHRRDNNKDDFNLSSEEQERYEHYRKVRNEVSMKKGVPPYVIFTNQELAIMARIPDLADVNGDSSVTISDVSALIDLLLANH